MLHLAGTSSTVSLFLSSFFLIATCHVHFLIRFPFLLQQVVQILCLPPLRQGEQIIWPLRGSQVRKNNDNFICNLVAVHFKKLAKSPITVFRWLLLKEPGLHCCCLSSAPAREVSLVCYLVGQIQTTRKCAEPQLLERVQ